MAKAFSVVRHATQIGLGINSKFMIGARGTGNITTLQPHPVAPQASKFALTARKARR